MNNHLNPNQCVTEGQRYPMRIGTIYDKSLVLITKECYDKLSRSETNADVVFTFLCGDSQIAVYHNFVQGVIQEDQLCFFSGNYHPAYPDYLTNSDLIQYSYNVTTAIHWSNKPSVYTRKYTLRERGPNTQPTPRFNDRKDETPIANNGQEARSPVPASLYSSWVHPEVEDSLAHDYWLSNLDRLICETLADGATIVNGYLAQYENSK